MFFQQPNLHNPLSSSSRNVDPYRSNFRKSKDLRKLTFYNMLNEAISQSTCFVTLPFQRLMQFWSFMDFQDKHTFIFASDFLPRDSKDRKPIWKLNLTSICQCLWGCVITCDQNDKGCWYNVHFVDLLTVFAFVKKLWVLGNLRKDLFLFITSNWKSFLIDKEIWGWYIFSRYNYMKILLLWFYSFK